MRKTIKDYLQHAGWFIFPVSQRGYHCYAGISDYIALKNGVVLFIEVKTGTGKLSLSQKEFGVNVTDKGGHYVLARSWQDVSEYIRQYL